jgi:hypothetical protein
LNLSSENLSSQTLNNFKNLISNLIWTSLFCAIIHVVFKLTN